MGCGEKNSVKKFSLPKRSGPNAVFLFLFILSLTIIPSILPNNYWQSVFSITGIYVLLALGLNIVAGFTGLLDLSYVASVGSAPTVLPFYVLIILVFICPFWLHFHSVP